MSYRIVFTKSAKKKFDRLDHSTRLILTKWIAKHLENAKDPRLSGKALSANRVGQWRYRIGDYRLIAEIEDDKLIILFIDVGHRREIYDL